MKDRLQYIESRSYPVPWSGCWAWMLSLSSNGYGNACDPETGSVMNSHRLSYVAFCGEIPDGMFVCHKCDNRICVNPEHLYVGTHIQNMDDIAKRRYHPRRKLTDADVRDVRIMIRERIAMRKIARLMSIDYATVHSIKDGKIYRYDGLL